MLLKTTLMRIEPEDLIKTNRLADIKNNPPEQGEKSLKAKGYHLVV